MSEETWKFRFEDKPKRDSGKVPNSNEECFIQSHSGIVIPYAPHLFVQSRKVSPNHESETRDGDTSGIEMVLDKLANVRISCGQLRARRAATRLPHEVKAL